MGVTSDATVIWKILNGVAAIYKPAGFSMRETRKTLIYHLCRDLNALEVRPPQQTLSIEGETNKPMTVKVGPSWSDHTLLVGPRYQEQDIKLSWANFLARDTSGVVIIGVNDGTRTVHKMRLSNPTRFYRIKGIFGQATDNYFKTGKIVEKATHKSIKRATIDAVCAAMQASHQRKMFELSGVDMQTQAAYELAVKGPIRPANNKLPMIYAIKCVAFNSPEFTLEIVCINEYENYLKTLIHDLGIQLHSVATCTQIQCFQYGLFTTEISLLKKHWELQYLIDNMKKCQYIIDNNEYLIRQNSPILLEPRSENNYKQISI